MRDDITDLSQADTRLLMQAALEISPSELKDLVSDSIQHGPAISLSGPLNRIYQQVIPPNCWEALKEFVDWGAGIIARDPSSQYDYLLADSAHVDRVLRSIAKFLDSVSGQSEKQATLSRQHRLAPTKPSRKYDDSPELG